MARYRTGTLSRERILDVAVELFAQRGYAGTGVDLLAQRAGISKTAIYYHFGSKEGLLAAALDRAATAWIEGIQAAARQAGRPIERLDRALAGMRALIEDQPWVLKLLQLLALEVAAEKPEIRATLRAIFDRARGAIVSGIAEGLGRDLPGAETVAAVVLALLDGVLLGRHIDPDAVPLEEAFREIRRIAVFMIASRANSGLARLFDDPEALLESARIGRAAAAARGSAARSAAPERAAARRRNHGTRRRVDR